MDKKAIIEALKKLEVDGGIISAIEALDNSAEIERLKGELESEQGKGAGILADKKKFKERAEAAESALKDIETAKLPEAERTAKQLQEMQDKLDAEKAERESDRAEYARVKRESELSDIASSIKWADGTPSSTSKLIISNALMDVQDLADKSKVGEILATVKETHKSFIAADAPSGSGSKGSGDVGGSNKSMPSSIASNQAAIWGDK